MATVLGMGPCRLDVVAHEHVGGSRHGQAGCKDPYIPVIFVPFAACLETDDERVSPSRRQGSQVAIDRADELLTGCRDRLARQHARQECTAIFVDQGPVDGCVRQWRRSEVRYLDLGVQCFTRVPDPFHQPSQRHRRPAEAVELLGCDIALLVPERVEHADQRRALAGKVVQVQQLEAAKARGAQRRLDLFLVTECLQFARCHEEVVRLVAHMIGVEEILEDLEILWLEHARVLCHLP